MKKEDKKHKKQAEQPLKAGEPSLSYDGHYTYGEYINWNFDHMVELIRGKIFKMSPAPSSMHQIVAGNLFLEIGNYLKGRSCRVFIAPFDVILPIPSERKRNESNTVVQPDLCVICDPALIEETGCFGVPDWVIEILSPHTSKKDMQLKYEAYEEVGVKEYWIVMPKEKLIEIFLLEEAKYQRKSVCVPEDNVSPFTLPELSIDLSMVFDY